jgi:hypothetical protein
MDGKQEDKSKDPPTAKVTFLLPTLPDHELGGRTSRTAPGW